jgi:hypothetical protein
VSTVAVKAKTFRQRIGPIPDIRPSAGRRGYDAAWQRLRAAFLKQNPLCFAPGCNQAATIADHVVPIAVDASRRLDWSNLRPCCATHHNILTSNFCRTGRNELPADVEAAATTG